MESTIASIQVDILSKQYGHFVALNNVSFSLPAGSFLTLFGRNGAGKTTLLRILACLLHSTGGTIFFDGKSISENASAIRRHIGFLSHQTMLYGDLSASENLRYYARLYGVHRSDELIRASLEKVGLHMRADDPARSFSRGMQQRLSIARAFIHQPRYLFLDEPFSGLDGNAIRCLMKLLNEFHTSDHSAIITTHQLEEGWEIADFIAILDKGKLCFFQSKQSISFHEFRQFYDRVAG